MGQKRLIRFQTASDVPRRNRYSFSFFRIFLILVGFANYSLVLAQKLRPNLQIKRFLPDPGGMDYPGDVGRVTLP